MTYRHVIVDGMCQGYASRSRRSYAVIRGVQVDDRRDKLCIEHEHLSWRLVLVLVIFSYLLPVHRCPKNIQQCLKVLELERT